jgi:F420-non-reducing hydrogenase iron-sulfur subunit
LAVVEAMLESLGLEKERFRLVWCSSAEAERFATCVREMTATVKSLGQSPYNMRAEAPLPATEAEVAACR